MQLSYENINNKYAEGYKKHRTQWNEVIREFLISIWFGSNVQTAWKLSYLFRSHFNFLIAQCKRFLFLYCISN